MLLHAVIVPTTKTYLKGADGKIKMSRVTIKDSQESFILYLKTNEEFAAHLKNLDKTKESIKPFIIVLGNSETS